MQETDKMSFAPCSTSCLTLRRCSVLPQLLNGNTWISPVHLSAGNEGPEREQRYESK